MKQYREKQADKHLYIRLVKNTSGTFVIKVCSTVFSFFVSILLARLLGAEGYGTYAYVMAIITILIIPSTLGFPQLLVRDMASYNALRLWGRMHGLLRLANRSVLASSVLISILGAIITGFIAEDFHAQMTTTLWIAFAGLPVMALTQIKQTALNGLGYIIEGQLLDMFIRSFLFITLVAGTCFVMGWKINTPLAMLMQIVSAVITLLTGIVILDKRLPVAVRKTPPAYEINRWVKSTYPLLIISALSMINAKADMIMLGAIKGAESVGIYTVANKEASLIVFILMSVNAALAPAVSGLYASGKMESLQRVVTKSARIVLGLSLPIAVGLIVFGKWTLLIFGHEFTRGDTALAILSLGQLINAMAGSVGMLLVMTGHEKDTAVGIGISTVLNVGLNTLLIPGWGIKGAAMATSSSMILWNFLLAVRVYKRLGIDPTALGRIGRW